VAKKSYAVSHSTQKRSGQVFINRVVSTNRTINMKSEDFAGAVKYFTFRNLVFIFDHVVIFLSIVCNS
jgi:hypothetical protein